MVRAQTSTKPHPRYATLPEPVDYCRSSRRSLELRMAEGKLTPVQERLPRSGRLERDRLPASR